MKREIPDLGLSHADRQNTPRHSTNGGLILSSKKWKQLATQHRERAERWTLPYRKRRASGQMHPIYDFLFIKKYVFLIVKFNKIYVIPNTICKIIYFCSECN